MLPSSLPFLLLTLALSNLCSATCFLPNGTANPSPGAAPCSTDPSNPLSAVCCNTKWSNPPGGDLKFGQPQDECLPNGLCQNRGMSTKQGEERPAWTHFYRVYCTSGEGEGCVGVCDGGLNADNVVQMTPCDGTPSSEKWCCGDSMECCEGKNAQKAVFVPKKLGESKVPPASFFSSSISSANSTAPDSSVSQHSLPDDSNANWKIGLGVGIGVGFPVMLVLGIFLGMFWLKRKNEGKEVEVHGRGDEMSIANGQVKRMGTDDTMMELETPVCELWGDRRCKAELA